MSGTTFPAQESRWPTISHAPHHPVPGWAYSYDGNGDPTAAFPGNAGGSFYAPSFGGTWNATSDVGPAINTAIATAAAAGGGTVYIPGGTFALATTINQNTMGVRLQGLGVGTAWDNASGAPHFWTPTRFIWIGPPGGTMCAIGPAPGATISLYCADVVGLCFDGQDTADYGIVVTHTSNSTFQIAGSECRKVNVWFTTSLSDAPGVQHCDIWASSRSTSAVNSPTGILLDSGGTHQMNVSYNRFHELAAWYAQGPGIVFGDCDNNVVDLLTTYPNPGNATGRPCVVSNGNYTMPNGMKTYGPAYELRVLHVGTPVSVMGSQTGIVVTPGANAGNLVLNAPVTLVTNAPTTYGGSPFNYLNFAAVSGVAAGMLVTGIGSNNTGIMPDSVTQTVSATQVLVADSFIATVPSGTTCQFHAGATRYAVAGTYTITATGANTFNVTAPAGGNSQTGLTGAAGILTATDLVIPYTGSAVAGDSWTVAIPAPSRDIRLEFVDAANACPNPQYQFGSTGAWLRSSDGLARRVQPSYSTLVVPDGIQNSVIASGVGSTLIGNNGQATGPYSTVVGGLNNVASSWYTFAAGSNNVASGLSSIALGTSNTTDALNTIGLGANTASKTRQGVLAFASGQIAASGDAQELWYVLRARTTSTTATVLTSNGSGANAATIPSIATGTANLIKSIKVIYRDTTTNNIATWHADNLMQYRQSAGPYAMVPATTTMTADQSVGTPVPAAPVITGNGSMAGLNVTVTAPNSNQSDWVATVECVEVG